MLGGFAVPHAPASAGLARRRLRDELSRDGVPQQQLDDLVLIVSELVGNAVRHACPLPSGGLHVNWLTDGGTVDVAVTDGGSQERPQARPVNPEAQSGRGLTIVEALASEWGVREDGAARTVWAELRAAQSHPRALRSVG